MNEKVRRTFERHRTLKLFGLLFVVLFLGRLAYGYYTTPNVVRKHSARERIPEVSEHFLSASSVKKNYASERYTVKGGGSASGSVAMAPALDQKYEKTATLTAATKSFEKDEKAIRDEVESSGAIIQFEQSRGDGGVKNRILQLMIGVQPEKFDDFCAAMRKIGRVESIEVTKTDKTNEFLNLRAQRESLEKTRAALVELKKMTGKVDEFVNLQYKILDIDRELRTLGVQLGDFDEVNEFCTVRMTLYEDYDVFSYPPRPLRRLMIAFTWTVKYGLALCASFAFFSMSLFFALRIGEAIKRWSSPHKADDR